ncbi:MAG: hypothetical protein V1875_09315 [Candidatus Altiarchaeota archaeon]
MPDKTIAPATEGQSTPQGHRFCEDKPSALAEKMGLAGVSAVDWGRITTENMGSFQPGLSGRLSFDTDQLMKEAMTRIAGVAVSHGFHDEHAGFALTEIGRNAVRYGGGVVDFFFEIGIDSLRYGATNGNAALFNPARYALMSVYERIDRVTEDNPTGHSGTIVLLGRGTRLKYKWEHEDGSTTTIRLEATPEAIHEQTINAGAECRTITAEEGIKVYVADRPDGSQLLTQCECAFQVVFRGASTQPDGTNPQPLPFEEFLKRCPDYKCVITNDGTAQKTIGEVIIQPGLKARCVTVEGELSKD